jgi:hypothetical protein
MEGNDLQWGVDVDWNRKDVVLNKDSSSSIGSIIVEVVITVGRVTT